MQVAALRALKTADLVVADRLVSAEILELVEGELKVARKLPVRVPCPYHDGHLGCVMTRQAMMGGCCNLTSL